MSVIVNKSVCMRCDVVDLIVSLLNNNTIFSIGHERVASKKLIFLYMLADEE